MKEVYLKMLEDMNPDLLSDIVLLTQFASSELLPVAVISTVFFMVMVISP